MSIVLGKRYKDIVSGVIGRAVARHDYLYGSCLIGLDFIDRPTEFFGEKRLEEIALKSYEDWDKSIEEKLGFVDPSNYPSMLGTNQQDRVTGVKGMVTAQHIYLDNSMHVTLSISGETGELYLPVDRLSPANV